MDALTIDARFGDTGAGIFVCEGGVIGLPPGGLVARGGFAEDKVRALTRVRAVRRACSAAAAVWGRRVEVCRACLEQSPKRT